MARNRKNMAGESPLNDEDDVSGTDGGRSISQESVRVGRKEGRSGADGKGPYVFFGDSDGHNKDNDPRKTMSVKPHTVSTLGNDPVRG